LYLYRVNDEVMKLLARGGYLEDIGNQNIFPARSRAVGFIYPKLDSDICRKCGGLIFTECRATLPNGEPREPVRPSVAVSG
jgi:sulfate permease, SulP family